MNYLKTFILTLVLLGSTSGFAQAKTEKPQLEECEDNGDMLGYALAIENICIVKLNERYESYLQKLNKQCIAAYGGKKIANATKIGIMSVKAEMEETGRNSTCLRALSDYKDLFN
ncbi:hypothetical protein [Acinetobacter seifertii]|uniref:hypothetical protein n=1 Tax=Acinetobacter seifertii TaxID=1530123 RepID=UPI004040FD77